MQPHPADNGQPAQTLDRLLRLQALTAALSQAVTSEQVADAILAHGQAVLGANAGCVALLSDDRRELVMLRVAGAPPEVAAKWRRFPLTAPVPLAEAVRGQAAVVLETFAERRARYPALEGAAPAGPGGALVALPMIVLDDALGGLAWGWPADRPFADEDRAFLLTLAGLCGQALDRARLYDRERAARQRAERAEASRREGEQRLRLIGDNLPLGAVYQLVADAAGGRQFTYISGGVERLFGVTPAEVLADAAALYGLVHEEDRDRVRAEEEAAGRDLAPFDCQFRSWTRSGGLVWVHARSAPRRLPAGETTWEGVVLDVTDRKRYEQSLVEADRRKDEFLATLAHELRNPLAPLRNGLQLMKLAGSDAGLAEQARGMMERQLAQMVRLIDDLLDVSRITRGKLRLRPERVELARVVQAAVEGSRPQVEAGGLDLAVALPPGPVYLEADPTRLAQVFGNLLTNAAKYTDRGGSIRLTAERRGGEVVVSVTDTGIGIAAEHLPRLFQMFSQAAPALERSQGGLGIGLALARGLVEMHGGTVEARSEGPGRGSEFVVRLPAPPGPPTPAPPPDSPGPPAVKPRRRVLVADDNRDAADSLAMLLRLAGHEVYAAHDGQEAVEAAARFRPEVALLDIGMPKLNGYEAAGRIRREAWGQAVVLVALTGWRQEEDRRRAGEAGFDHHLTKPVDPADLERFLAALPARGQA